MWSLTLWRETGWAYLGQCFLSDRKEVSPKHMGNVASGATMMHEDVWLLARDAAVRDMQPQGLIKYSLGHGSAVQTWVSLPFPLQSLPPIWGTGALQCLILVICPSPHVAEQEDHGDHRLQPPSWRTRWGKQKSNIQGGTGTSMHISCTITTTSTLRACGSQISKARVQSRHWDQPPTLREVYLDLSGRRLQPDHKRQVFRVISVLLRWIYWRRELCFLLFRECHLLFNSVLTFSTVSSLVLHPYVKLLFQIIVQLWPSPPLLQIIWQLCGYCRSFKLKWKLEQRKRIKKNPLPRLSHLTRLHLRVWIEGPVQGLLVASHERPLCWVPVPQVTVHSVHSDQGDQPSSLSTAGNSEDTRSKSAPF